VGGDDVIKVASRIVICRRTAEWTAKPKGRKRAAKAEMKASIDG
jgi:hypothetical protein